MGQFRQNIVVILGIIILISGCSFGGGYAPVYAPGESEVKSVRFHVVQPGETLYSIAFRYGLNYQVIASANDISEPYTIYVNQRLRLAGKQKVAVKSSPKATPKVATPTKKETVVRKS